VVASAFKEDAQRQTLPVDQIPEGWMASKSDADRRAYADEAGRAELVLWNGPMGVFEMKPFAAGTLAMAARARGQPGHFDRGRWRQRGRHHTDGPGGRMTNVSTGGGASLEFLSGKPLPGVACLSEQA